MKPYIFISYSHAREDREHVRSFVSKLESRGIEYFRDTRDIRYGENIPDAVRRALERSTHVVPFLSPGSKEWVFFEIGVASSYGKTIVPRLLHSSIQLPTFLGNPRYIASSDHEDDFIGDLLVTLRVLTGTIERKEEGGTWAFARPETGASLFFRPSDVIPPLTIEDLEVGDTVEFEEVAESGMRSRLATKVRRTN